MVDKYFGCSIDDIAESVIITPIWRINDFIHAADDVIIEFSGWYRGATLLYGGKRITTINSCVGAPLTGDCVLALGYTNCSHIIFSGSAGALASEYKIGDLVVADEAVIGEGFSRYHRGNLNEDCFGKLSIGYSRIFYDLLCIAKKSIANVGAELYHGKIFSIDSILGETEESFEMMKKANCTAVEMEVSAVFTAAKKIGIEAIPLLIISDLPLKYKSLYEGITDEDMALYNIIQKKLPEILLMAAAKYEK